MFYICYVERSSNVHKELLEKLAENKFKVDEIAKDVTKPINGMSFIYKITR